MIATERFNYTDNDVLSLRIYMLCIIFKHACYTNVRQHQLIARLGSAKWGTPCERSLFYITNRVLFIILVWYHNRKNVASNIIPWIMPRIMFYNTDIMFVLLHFRHYLALTLKQMQAPNSKLYYTLFICFNP